MTDKEASEMHRLRCEVISLRASLRDLTELVELDEEAEVPGTDLYSAIRRAQRLLERPTQATSKGNDDASR